MFERHPQTSIHPKACGINQRTVEIFRIMGIEDEVCQHAAPPHIAGRTAWYTGFGNEGREIISRDAWGEGMYAEEYATFSPCRYCILPQIRLEPILKRRALALNSDGIIYNAEVCDIHQNDTDACVDVHHRDSGQVERHHARYVIVADGGRMFTDHLGVSWGGEKDIYQMVTAHFRAPLRPLHPDPRNFITWFSNPEMGGSTRTGYLYQIGPWPSRSPEEDEWVFVCGKVDGDPAKFDEASMIQRMCKTIQIPDLPVEMLSFSHWTVNAIYAETWQVGRAFLVGDSAHRIPPWGALGMNTGIQDAQNLVWKLELALEDEEKYAGLLKTYQAERLEVGRRVGLTSLHNMRTHSQMMEGALGIDANQSPEANKQSAAPFFDPDHPNYQANRAAVQNAQKVLDSEFKAPGFEVGWFYPSADINGEGGETHGGQQLPDGTPVSEFYFPSTIP